MTGSPVGNALFTPNAGFPQTVQLTRRGWTAPGDEPAPSKMVTPSRPAATTVPFDQIRSFWNVGESVGFPPDARRVAVSTPRPSLPSIWFESKTTPESKTAPP